MRTKALLGLAVLAAGALTCVAQSNVYSLNIVGYVNVTVQGGNKLTLLSNPLKPSNGNYNITNTIKLPDTAENAELYSWATNKWSGNIPTWVAGYGWFSDQPVTVNLGESFFIKSPVATTVTFVGEVATGDVPYTVPSGTSVIAPKIPVAESFPGATNGHEGDQIYTWTGSAWSSPWEFVGGYGWFSDAPGAPAAGPVIPVGGGLVFINKGAPLSWTKSFNP